MLVTDADHRLLHHQNPSSALTESSLMCDLALEGLQIGSLSEPRNMRRLVPKAFRNGVSAPQHQILQRLSRSDVCTEEETCSIWQRCSLAIHFLNQTSSDGLTDMPASASEGAGAQGLSAPLRWICDHIRLSFDCDDEAIKRLLSSDSRCSFSLEQPYPVPDLGIA